MNAKYLYVIATSAFLFIRRATSAIISYTWDGLCFAKEQFHEYLEFLVPTKLNYTRNNDSELFRGGYRSAGLDLKASRLIDEYGDIVKYGTMIKVAIPDGYFGLLVERSSLHKHGYTLANSVGIIDSDYRGELLVCVRRKGENSKDKEELIGERIAQLIIVPYAHLIPNVVNHLDNTVRGEGGFGSTS